MLGKIVYYIGGFLGIILWVYCLINNSKITNKSIHLVLLIILTAIYVPFYYYIFVFRKRPKFKEIVTKRFSRE
jgi:hypothetical protein